MNYKLTQWLIITVVLINITACNKEEKYIISGTVEVENLKIDSIKIINIIDNKIINSTKVRDGEFLLTGFIDQPTKVRISTSGNVPDFPMILENDNYAVSFPSDLHIKGGKINTIIYGYRNLPKYTQVLEEIEDTRKLFIGIDMTNKETVTNARRIFRDKWKLRYNIVDSYQNKILEGDYSVLTKVFALSINTDYKNYPIQKRLTLYDSYAKQLGDNSLIKLEQERLIKRQKIEEKEKTLAIGKSYKEISAKKEDGTVLKLSETISNNKLILLEFWASWCGPCRGQFPHLKKAYNKYKNKGFEIYAISLDKNRDKWLKALREENTIWPNLIDIKAFKSKAAQDYNVFGIPASYLIDANGKIVAKNLRDWALEEKLKELLDE